MGIVYHGTTRNEVNARFAGHEDYEPGIPDVTVRPEGPGRARAATVLNDYTTDHWRQRPGLRGAQQHRAA